MGCNVYTLEKREATSDGVALYGRSKPSGFATLTDRMKFTLPATSYTDSLGTVSVSAVSVNDTSVLNNIVHSQTGYIDYTLPSHNSSDTIGGHTYYQAVFKIFSISWSGSASAGYTAALELEATVDAATTRTYRLYSPTNTTTSYLIVPLYIRLDWTVSFNRQGGSGGSSSVTATRGSNMPAITLPTKTGYSFAGYFTSTGGSGTKYYNDDGSSARKYNKTENITLYADWTANTYLVSLNRQGGTGGTNNIIATYGAPMPSATMPSKAGYVFGGFFTDTNGIGTKYYNADGSSARNWDIDAVWPTLYAYWIPDTYTVYLSQTGATTQGTAVVTATYGAAMPAITRPYREGYGFGGYFTQTDGAGTQYYNADGSSARSWDLTATTTLYPYWLTPITALLDPQGGSLSAYSKRVFTGLPYNYPAATSADNLPTPTRTGYSFDGWYTAATGGVQVTNATVVTATAQHTLYAHWSQTPTNHTVYFDAAGGAVSESTRTVTGGSAIGSASNPLPTPTRTGYTFAGWYTQTVGGSQVTAATVMPDDDLFVYAQWTANTVTITFDANGGTVSEASRSVSYGQQIGRLPDPTRANYCCIGWFTDPTAGTQATNATVATASVTLYAHWGPAAIDWWRVTFS